MATVTANTPLKIIAPLRGFAFQGIVVLSGVAGLGYQVVWGRMLAVSLGHEIVATLAVIAAFFFGLGLGAVSLNSKIMSTRSPQRWYAGLEFIIGIWAVLLTLIIPLFNQSIPVLIGLNPSPAWHWAVAFCSSLVLFLPATFAMGATLPAIEKSVRGFARQQHPVAGLYALNTLGAVIGVLTTAFFIVPVLGLTTTSLLFVIVNTLCAVGTLLLFKSACLAEQIQASKSRGRDLYLNKNHLMLMLFFCGLLGLGYEVLIIRVLSQILENTVYSFAAILAVYLLGTVLGASLYQRTWAHSQLDSRIWRQRLSWLLILTSGLCLLGTACLWLSYQLYGQLSPIGESSLAMGIMAELAVAGLVFLMPTLAMGALFSHLAQHSVQTIGLGKAISCNTFGAMLAPLIFGVILLPALSAKTCLILTAVGYLLLIPGLTKTLAAGVAIPLGFAVVIMLVPSPLRFLAMPESSDIVEYREGVMASVAVVKDSTNDRHLKVNNHFTMGGTASRYSDYRQTHLPFLLHGSPQSALFLGLGTGVTLQAAKYHSQVTTTGVELLPEALELMHHFDVNPYSEGWHIKPTVYAADARRYILATDHTYDVIIAEIFHPSRDGAGSLYTREHFQLIKQKLAPGGLFCQWLPLFQLDLTTLKIIVRTFIEVFPYAQLHLGHFSLQQPILCLLGSVSPKQYNSQWLLNRVHDRQLQQHLVNLRLNSDFALFGGFLAGKSALQKATATTPINTDDHPVVTYQAPEFVYTQQTEPAARLSRLIKELAGQGYELSLAPASEGSDFANQLQAYWRARDLFLQAGVGIKASDDIRRIAAATQDSLLKAVRLSEHFSPAYRSLLGLAQGLHQVDPQASLALLNKLIASSPQQLPARQMRRQWFGY